LSKQYKEKKKKESGREGARVRKLKRVKLLKKKNNGGWGWGGGGGGFCWGGGGGGWWGGGVLWLEKNHWGGGCGGFWGVGGGGGGGVGGEKSLARRGRGSFKKRGPTLTSTLPATWKSDEVDSGEGRVLKRNETEKGGFGGGGS